jgi:hypothetical protein
MKKKLIYILIPVFVLILFFSSAAACSSSAKATKVGDTSSTGISSATETTKAATETTVEQIYNVGDSVKLKGVVVTVKSFTKSNGNDLDKPKEGMEFVIVTVNIKNNSQDKVSYNPLYFKMQNSKGQITDPAIVTTVDSKTALSSGELATGGEVEGTIVFEQPKDDPGLILIYEANILNENEVIKFNIK